MGAELDRAVIGTHLPQHFSRSLESATFLLTQPLTNRRSRRHQLRILSRSPSRTTKKRRSGKG
ncbi:hypothetical protein C4D60_Mb08t24710 [Musa balbisiana]|uniref:Uncharacterized protein n=1 Tax=Musa balbisiana TaxID=52838 RepID=A0A4S8K688_MUSBA|nr:hypothetical protein C4D60_Mb08t24710 [Musa balbisiana]